MRLQHIFNVASKEEFARKTDRQIDSYYIGYFPFARRRSILKYKHNNFSNKASFYDWRLSRIVFHINCFWLWFGKIQFTFMFFLIFELRTNTFILQWCRTAIFELFPCPSTFETGNGNDTGGFFVSGLVFLITRWMEHYYVPNPKILSSKRWVWFTNITDRHTDTQTDT
jgi:hypothetical protein